MSENEVVDNLNRKIDEHAKKIEKGSVIAGNLDIIETKLRNLPKHHKTYILSAKIRPTHIKEKYEILAEIEMMSTAEPNAVLEDSLKELIYCDDSNSDNPNSCPVKIYDIEPFDLGFGYWKFKIDVILSRMEMDPHDYLELN